MGGYNFRLLNDDEDQYSVLQKLVGDETQPTTDPTPAPLQASATDPQVADFQARLDAAKAARASQVGNDDGMNVLDDLVAQHEHRSHTAGDIDTGLAMLLDVAANKGRGLGQIVGAYSRNREEESNQDEHFKEQVAFAKAKRKELDPVTEAFQQQRIIDTIKAQREAAARAAAVQDRAEHNWAQNESPEAPKQTTAVEVAKRKAAANVEGRETQRSEMLPTIEDTESGITRARTTAGTKAKNETPPDITPAEQARLDREDRRIAESEQAHADAVALRDATLDNTKAVQRRGDADAFRNQTKDQLTALMHARDLLKQIDAAGKHDVPGLTNAQMIEPNLILDQQSIHNQEILQQLINPETKKYFGVAVNPQEAESRGRAYATGKFSGEAAREEAVRTIAQALESGVRGAIHGHEGVAADILKEYGLEDLMPPQDAPPSARDALPQVRVPAADTLPVEPGKAGKTRTSLDTGINDWRKRYAKYRAETD